MPSLRHIRKRIASVKSTEQITRAMKMVAAARFRKAQEAVLAARPYAREMQATLARVALHKDVQDHPLLARREPVVREDLFVLTSDRGLCGGFNSSVLRALEHYLLDHHARRDSIRVHTIGAKGFQYCKKNKLDIYENVKDVLGNPNYRRVMELSDDLARRFVAKEIDRVTLLLAEFKSAIQQTVVFRTLLPLEPPQLSDDERSQVDYLFEPVKGELLDRLIHRYLSNQLFMVILESIASEQGARMTAMENATNNAKDMISSLTLTYNKARQATITRELMEIVGGAEALKSSGA
jgi:F-type H+-transporting ATPase subunit gamma